MHSSFVGNDRFELVRPLGAGGVGSVYEVLDRKRDARRALKAVGPVTGDDLLRFKREFRSLQGLSHPNLVHLGELFEDHGSWYFTMELVGGVRFSEYVRAEAPHAPEEPTQIASGSPFSLASATIVDEDDDPTPPPTGVSVTTAHPPHRFDEQRLRGALGQLVRAVLHLHRHKKVHRDLKPANVLVTPEGRVVVIDFGLVDELEEHRIGAAMLVGTYRYMAPEQARGEAVDGRADWYAVGVMLYEVLVGRSPYAAKGPAVLSEKLARDHLSPADAVDGLPLDLVVLCERMLRLRPDDRAGDEEIAGRLGIDPREEDSLSYRGGDGPFVGREDALERLLEPTRNAGRSGLTILLVRGPAGVGKTRFVEELVRRARADAPELLILRGRPGEREQVPYPAIDGLVDDLSHHLARLPAEMTERLRPPHAARLLRVFPVLTRVPGFAPRTESITADDAIAPSEQRARLFHALRALVRSVVLEMPALVWIDDLHALDADSAALLGELLRVPGAPPFVFVGTYTTPSPDGALAFLPRDVRTTDVELGPLDPSAARSLARALLRGSPFEPDDASFVARESGGMPLLVDELVHYLAHGGSTKAAPRLEDVLRLRIEAIPESARHLLRHVAASGGRAPVSVLAEATGLESEELAAAAQELDVRRLVVQRERGGEACFDLVRDRIGGVALSGLAREELLAIHRALAEAWQRADVVDEVALATSWEHAGEKARAARSYERAAREALDRLAFQRAAGFFARALALGVPDDRTRAIQVALAEALALAGRGAEAAEAFQRAAHAAQGDEAVDLTRRAAEQLVLSGHLARGEALFRELLESVGERYETHPARAIATMLFDQLVVAVRGVDTEPRSAPLPTRDRVRMDVLASASSAIVPVRSIHGGALLARSYRRAARAGDPARLAVAMAYSASAQVAMSVRGVDTALSLLHRSHALARASGDARARGVVRYGEGLIGYMLGQLRPCRDALSEAEHIFRNECRTPAPELRTCLALVPPVLFELGEWDRFVPTASRNLQEAREWGDPFLVTNVGSTTHPLLGLLDDDAEAHLRAGREAFAGWQGGHDNQRFAHLESQGWLLSYLGRSDELLARLDVEYRGFSRALVLKVLSMHVRARRLRAELALARANRPSADRARCIRVAKGDVRFLLASRLPVAVAHGRCLEAGLVAASGASPVAIGVALDRAIMEAESANLVVLAWLAKLHKGRLLGDGSGDRLADRAIQALGELGVKRPEKLADVFLPGLRR